MIADAGFANVIGRTDPRRARRNPRRLEDLTTAVVHLWRLLKWGRTLARHGALAGIERDPLTPPFVRRLARVARFGASMPGRARLRRRAAGDRPRRDQVRPGAGHPPRPGRRRRRDQPPPAPGLAPARAFPGDQGGDRSRARRAARNPVQQVRRSAGRRRLDRPGPPRRHHRRPRGRGQGASPGHRGRIRPGDRDL